MCIRDRLNLLLDLVHADDAGDEQTGRNGRNRHHDRVRQEVEEVEELHPDDRDPRQRAVACLLYTSTSSARGRRR